MLIVFVSDYTFAPPLPETELSNSVLVNSQHHITFFYLYLSTHHEVRLGLLVLQTKVKGSPSFLWQFISKDLYLSRNLKWHRHVYSKKFVIYQLKLSTQNLISFMNKWYIAFVYIISYFSSQKLMVFKGLKYRVRYFRLP